MVSRMKSSSVRSVRISPYRTQNETRTKSTDFPRVENPSSCFVLFRNVSKAKRSFEKAPIYRDKMVLPVWIEHTTSPLPREDGLLISFNKFYFPRILHAFHARRFFSTGSNAAFRLSSLTTTCV